MLVSLTRWKIENMVIVLPAIRKSKLLDGRLHQVRNGNQVEALLIRWVSPTSTRHAPELDRAVEARCKWKAEQHRAAVDCIGIVH